MISYKFFFFDITFVAFCIIPSAHEQAKVQIKLVGTPLLEIRSKLRFADNLGKQVSHMYRVGRDNL